MRLKLITGSLLIVIMLLVQACQRRITPEESCNFVQNSTLQRVSWNKNVPVKLLIHDSVKAQYYPAFEAAVEYWNKALGMNVLKIEAYGITGAAQPKKDGYSVIYWLNEWESEKSNEQARTTIHWSGKTIAEADMKINNKNFQYFTGADPDYTKVSLESLLVHEFGHILGLAHNNAKGSVMNVSLANGTLRTSPDKQDIKDLKCEY